MTTEREEIDRLTRELDEAKKENERLGQLAYSGWRSDSAIPFQQLCRDATLAKLELEARLAWRKVSEGLPTADGDYLVRDLPPDVGAEVMILQRDAINAGCWDYWLGPLPAAPHEAEPPRDKP